MSHWSTLPEGTSRFRESAAASQTRTRFAGFKVRRANHSPKPPWTLHINDWHNQTHTATKKPPKFQLESFLSHCVHCCTSSLHPESAVTWFSRRIIARNTLSLSGFVTRAKIRSSGLHLGVPRGKAESLKLCFPIYSVTQNNWRRCVSRVFLCSMAVLSKLRVFLAFCCAKLACWTRCSPSTWSKV